MSAARVEPGTHLPRTLPHTSPTLETHVRLPTDADLGFDSLPHYDAVQKFLPHEFLAISSPGSVGADGKPVDSLVQQRQANGAWDTVGITRAVDRGGELTQEDFLE